MRLCSTLILAHEITKGMKSIGSKALLQIHNQSILDYQISYIAHYYPESKTCIATGFEHDKIRKKISKYPNVECLFNPDYEYSNNGKSLQLYLESHNPKNLLIINNGILFTNKLKLSNSNTIYSLKKQKNGFHLGSNHNNNNIYYIFYDLPLVWSECILLNEESIAKLKKIILHRDISQLFLFEIINLLLEENINIISETIDNKDIIKITNHKDLYKIKNYEKNICTKFTK